MIIYDQILICFFGLLEKVTYAYDAAGQLTEFLQTTGYGERYAYDGAGNMTEKVLTGTDGAETTLAMKYNKGNQLTGMANGRDKIAYKYDKNGSMVEKTLSSQSYGKLTDSYAYNALDQLTNYVGYDGYRQAFTYDANGMRQSKSEAGDANRSTLEELLRGNVAGLPEIVEPAQSQTNADVPAGLEWATTEYLYDLTQEYYQVISETTTYANGTSATTAYAYGLERIAAYHENGVTRYVYDGRGSVAQAISAPVAGAAAASALPDISVKVQTFSYTAYGEQMGGVKVSGFTYNAEAYDAATGMLNLRARQYEPILSRFSLSDKNRGTALTPISLARYIITYNAPTVYIDAGGNMPTPAPNVTPVPSSDEELHPMVNPPPPTLSPEEQDLKILYALSQGNFGQYHENLDGIDAATIIYDGRPDESEGGKGFPNQATAIQEEYINAGVDVEMKAYTSINGFIDQFNSISKTDLLIVVGHGSPGTLDIDGKYLKENPSADETDAIDVQTSLSRISVTKGVLLYACNGATQNQQGKTTAQWISQKTGSAPVLAANTSVKYLPNTGHPTFSTSSTSSNPILKFVEKVASAVKNFVTAEWSVTRK